MPVESRNSTEGPSPADQSAREAAGAFARAVCHLLGAELEVEVTAPIER